MLAPSVARPHASHLPPDDKRRDDPNKDEVIYQRPTTGRNTKPIHDPPTGIGLAGHIAPVHIPPTSGQS